ncbi:MAG: hypothetical protein IIZ39_02105, partial [Blautia sp.]|nr:hypothetical protein [Blautia sp.]
FTISEVPVEYDNTQGIGVAVTKGDNESLLAFINDYIAKVKEDGTWDQWVEDAVSKSASLLKEEAE